MAGFSDWENMSDSKGRLTILPDYSGDFSTIASNIDFCNCDERSVRRTGFAGRESGSVVLKPMFAWVFKSSGLAKSSNEHSQPI